MKNLLKVFHIPDWSKGNPYQRLLLDNLKKLGVEIRIIETHRFFSLLRAFFGQGKPAIIHIHWQHPLLLAKTRFETLVKSLFFVLELVILKALRVKIVWTVHNIKNHENRHQKMELFFTTILSRLADVIIAHCKSAKSEIQRILKIRKNDKIAVIPHGNFLDCYKNTISKDEAKKQLKFSSTNLTFLYMGQIRPYKGVPELIDAFQKLNTINSTLIIAGRPQNGQIAEQIKRKSKGYSNIKVILEFIADDDIQIYMNAADVVVFPYRDILTSGGIILAMSFDKVIIAPNRGCIPDTLDNSGSFLYEPNEQGGLLNAMREAMASRNKLQKMGSHNLELAMKLDWESVAKSTQNVYEKCL